MSPTKSIILATGILTAIGTTAFAHDLSRVNRTQADQVYAIEQARLSGQLTRREYNALIAEQARIAALQEKAQSDGNVTGREYRAIRESQREAGQHIYQESNDGQVSWWQRWKYNVGTRY